MSLAGNGEGFGSRYGSAVSGEGAAPDVDRSGGDSIESDLGLFVGMYDRGGFVLGTAAYGDLPLGCFGGLGSRPHDWERAGGSANRIFERARRRMDQPLGSVGVCSGRVI